MRERSEPAGQAWPAALVDDLRERVGLDGSGQLLDLACGTGQVTLAFAPYVERVVAVDREQNMVDEARHQAVRAGIGNVDWEINSAEDVRMPPGSVRLVTIRNAFHRMDRPLIAKLALVWLAPDGWLALLHSNSFWSSDRNGTDSGPARTHAEVLRDEGFGSVEEYAFTTSHYAYTLAHR